MMLSTAADDDLAIAVEIPSDFHFYIILFGIFCIACVLVICGIIYKNWKRHRLTNPVREHIYKH